MAKRENQPDSLPAYEKLARKRIKRGAYDYIAGGAGDESGLVTCRADLDACRLVSRVLRGVQEVDSSVEILGERLPFPILVAPTASHAIVHRRGEIETARGIKEIDTVFILSTLSSEDVEKVARKSGARLWFQLYFFKDREITREIVQRAEAAGCRALVLTVDLPVVGMRYRDFRNRFKSPVSSQLMRMLESKGMLGGESKEIELQKFFDAQRNPGLTWKDVDWLRGITKMPILIKGILSAHDAVEARKRSLAGIVVSTHGGRQLDGLASPISVLPRLREAVGEKMTVLIDGGIRTGTDVLRCLCLGANGVLIGRPVLWGLAVGGAAGVSRVLSLVGEEMKRGMAILGASRVGELGPEFLYRGSGAGRAWTPAERP